jgi:hypothetical protein
MFLINIIIISRQVMFAFYLFGGYEILFIN